MTLSELRKVLSAAKSKAEFNRLWANHSDIIDKINAASMLDRQNLRIFKSGVLEHFMEKARFEKRNALNRKLRALAN